jgi:hypothetical protein
MKRGTLLNFVLCHFINTCYFIFENYHILKYYYSIRLQDTLSYITVYLLQHTNVSRNLVKDLNTGNLSGNLGK